MKKNLNSWKGCFTAVITPFKKNGDLDRKAFCRNLELLVEEGLDGVVIAGCTGESWLLSDEEKKELFRLSVDQIKGRMTVIGGASQITAEATIPLCQYAKKVGMDGVMILAPPMVHPNAREIYTYFETISDAVDMPILLYNNPRRQGVDLVPEIIRHLVRIKNIVAIKEASKDFMRVSEVIRLVGNKVRVFAGHSSMQGVQAVVMGAVGWVGSLDTQILGKEAIDMYDLVEKGEIEKAIKIQYKCIALEQGMKGKQAGTFPAGLKYAMNLRNRPGGYPRKPILPLTEQEKQYVKSLLRQLNLL